MKKLIASVVPAIVLIILPQFAGSVKACSCPPPLTPYQAYHEARAVFVGKVTGSKDVPYTLQGQNGNIRSVNRYYSFSVEESFKGADASEVEINAGMAISSCFSPFNEGETYLVYAYGNSESVLSSGVCTRTTTLERASDDLYHIRALLKGVPEPRFYGFTLKIDYDYAKSTLPEWKPHGGVKVIVEGDDRRFEAMTDGQGRFSFPKMPDGKYKARLDLPDKYSVYSYPGESEFVLGSSEDASTLTQQGDSAYKLFVIRWNNQVSGKLLDAEGNILRRAKAAVLLARSDDSPLVIQEDTFDHKPDGKYQFNNLPPGKYILSVRIRAPFKSADKEKRFYYPSAVSLNLAGEIVIGESDKLIDTDIKLPPGYVQRTIEGVLVWPDGSLVEDGWVFLADAEQSGEDDEKYDWTSTSGRFNLEGFEGAEYWVHASVHTRGMKTSSGKDLGDGGVRQLKAQPVKVTVGRANEPLRIVMPLPEGVEKPKK